MVMFFIDAALTLFVSLILFLYVVRNMKNSNLRNIRHASGVLGILYLIVSIVLIFMSFEMINFEVKDFILIVAIFLFIQSIILFYYIYHFNQEKKMYFLFLVSVFMSLIYFIGFSYTLLFTSLIFTLLLFVYFLFISRKKTSGVIGLFYASLTLLLYLISFFAEGSFFAMNIASNLFFLFFIHSFLRDADKNKKEMMKYRQKKNSYILNFIRYLIFILVLVNLIFVATLGVHEVGHLLLSKVYGCEYGRVVYESDMPRTEILCNESINKDVISLGGIFFPILISILLFIGGGKFIKEIALILFGFNFIFSYQDLIDIFIPESVAVFILLIGIAEIGIGISLLAKSRTEEEVFTPVY